MIWGQISPDHGDRGAKPSEGGGGRSFWLLCVVVVFCVVARDLGRFFCARKQAIYGRTKLDFILPVVLLCYPKIPGHEKRYMPYILKIWY
jgi:hypothetical protein